MCLKTIKTKMLFNIQKLKFVSQAKIIILLLTTITFFIITSFTNIFLKKDILRKQFEAKQAIVNLQSYNAKTVLLKSSDMASSNEWIEVNISSSKKGDIIILANKSGTVFFSKGSKNITEKELQELTKNILQQNIESPIYISFKNIKYMPVVSEENESGLFVICLTPKKQIESTITPSVNVSILIGITLVLLSTLLISFLIRYFTRPLLFLSEKINRLATGDFSVTTNIRGCKEIEKLSTDFNKMVEQINDLIQTDYVAKIEWKNAQFEAFKAKMNPHFLNNTLQTISAEAIENNQMKIYDMVVSLSSILNYVMQEQDTVTLETEVNHTTDYLLIQKQRFENRLTYAIDIDKKINLLIVPKISIMCLVENAILHGISKTTKDMHIQISASIEQNTLIITVTDDGDGIPEETLQALQKSLTDSSKASKQQVNGLKNLSNRLKFLYGDSAKLSVYSTVFTGTTIIIELDISKEQKK